MPNIMPPKDMLESFVPVTRFNRGEAGKIFSEVKECGQKIVVKNNTPECVILSVDVYKEMMEMLEDSYLIALANERMGKVKYTKTLKQIMDESGITMDDVADYEEVEFE